MRTTPGKEDQESPLLLRISLSESPASEIAAQIRDQVNATQSSSSRHISTTTVKRRLCAAGLHGKIAARKPLLRTGNKQKRLVWAKEHKEWTLDQWKSVLWSDESKFEIFGSNHRVFVRRRKGERMDSTCLVPTVKHGRRRLSRKSVMVLSIFSFNDLKSSGVEWEFHPCFIYLEMAEEVYQHLHNILDFGKHIMKQFLGENYVHHGDVVQLPLDFLKRLCVKVQSERPESRCEKDMDVSGYAMCLPNLTRLQTFPFVEHRPIFCIEIKPKCGFIPSSAHITKEVKKKVAKGKWKRISKYCPLDLFSGHTQRMHFALMSLLQESQNNLKIFKNGELIYGCRDDQEYLTDLNELARQLKPFFFPANGLVGGSQCTKNVLKELIHVLTSTLLSPGTDAGRAGNMKPIPGSQGRNYCEAGHLCTEYLRSGKHKMESTGLPKGCILYKLLQAQMLDMLDIKGLHPLYKRVEKYLEECPEER
ncbi:unnamed protein product [Ranitomeya imitator]|uniref:Inositol-pentakisphosphate 2-kinase n=1 Tax=Ranitomeya imitator TaxID=111125 RepID=A0ABN9KRK7_9NEOB|nr:unnamed protein product [Ranitomeya imitator]